MLALNIGDISEWKLPPQQLFKSVRFKIGIITVKTMELLSGLQELG